MIRTLLLLALLVTGSASAQSFERPALASGQGVLALAGLVGTSPLPPGVLLSAIAPAGPLADWLAAGTAGETHLYLVRGDGDLVERLNGPRETAATVAEPVPISDEKGRLVGLAWLAGRDRAALAVRFAPWEGDRWGPAVTVAAPGPGSQLALAAAARGGTVVLAWSSFDGSDDEILTSRRVEGRWSAPRRVAPDNTVPDVTPALAADGDGFLLVWSGFDAGEYRLRGSRLRADQWSAPVTLGPPGSLFPVLAPSERGSLLLYRDAREQTWTVLELDRSGRTLSRARLAAPSDAAPAILAATRTGVRLLVAGSATEIRWEAVP